MSHVVPVVYSQPNVNPYSQVSRIRRSRHAKGLKTLRNSYQTKPTSYDFQQLVNTIFGIGFIMVGWTATLFVLVHVCSFLRQQVDFYFGSQLTVFEPPEHVLPYYSWEHLFSSDLHNVPFSTKIKQNVYSALSFYQTKMLLDLNVGIVRLSTLPFNEMMCNVITTVCTFWGFGTLFWTRHVRPLLVPLCKYLKQMADHTIVWWSRLWYKGGASFGSTLCASIGLFFEYLKQTVSP